MSGDLRIDFSQQCLENIEINLLLGVLVAVVRPFDVSVSCNMLLQFQDHLSNIGLDKDLLDVVTDLLMLDQRVVEDLFPSHTFVFVDHQTLLQEVLGVLTDLSIVRETERFAVDSVQILIQASAGPWDVTKDHLIEHETKTPNIRFGSIRLVLEELRSHVDRCSANVSQFLLSKNVSLAGKSEVCDLVVLVLDKSVSWLDIAVDVALMDQDAESCNNLFKGVDTFIFSKFP